MIARSPTICGCDPPSPDGDCWKSPQSVLAGGNVRVRPRRPPWKRPCLLGDVYVRVERLLQSETPFKTRLKITILRQFLVSEVIFYRLRLFFKIVLKDSLRLRFRVVRFCCDLNQKRPFVHNSVCSQFSEDLFAILAECPQLCLRSF